MRKKVTTYPELLADLAEHIAIRVSKRLEKHGIKIDNEIASDVGYDASEFVRGHWGGQRIYLLKGVQYEFHLRDLKIFDKFNGHNHLELAKEYGLTDVRIYQIVKAVRAELVKKRQGALF